MRSLSDQWNPAAGTTTHSNNQGAIAGLALRSLVHRVDFHMYMYFMLKFTCNPPSICILLLLILIHMVIDTAQTFPIWYLKSASWKKNFDMSLTDVVSMQILHGNPIR